MTGLVDLRRFEANHTETNLMPSRELSDAPIGSPARGTRLTGRLGLDYQIEALSLSTQLRGLVETNEKTNKTSEEFLDEAYGEFALTDRVFVYAGRKHVSVGKAYSLSPLDLFVDQLETDRVLNENRRQRETEGSDLVGLDWFAGDTLRFSFVHAPAGRDINEGKSHRSQITLDLVVPGLYTDLVLLAYQEHKTPEQKNTREKTPVLGAGLAFGLGPALTLYAEETARRGRVLVPPRLSDAASGAFSTENPEDASGDLDADNWFHARTLGIGYTGTTGVSLNIEYHHNEAGLDDRAWRDIVEIAQINADQIHAGQNEQNEARARGNLLRLNGALRAATLRQNYAFVRLAWAEVLGVSGLESEWTVLHQLDDQSRTMALRLEYDIRGRYTLGLFGTASQGDENSEFGGLRSERSSLAFYLTRVL